MHEASYYQVDSDEQLSCLLCPQGCKLAPGKTGFCKVRQHEGGQLIATNYGKVFSISLDPIEKKPLYHFYPGKPILSVGTIGCSLACEFCQNWQISREEAPCKIVNPSELAELALETHQTDGNIGLAYTYSEPGVWFEFLMGTMPIVHEYGLKNVLVTNAFLNPQPWLELLHWTDAANIDLKGFDEEYYRKLCHGKLQPVMDNIEAAVGKIHIELTTLVIPGENDHPAQIGAMAEWIAGLDPEIPLHLSRYFPNYKLAIPSTPEDTMEQAAEIARKYLKFVYLGNVAGSSDTVCPDCGTLLITRNGHNTQVIASRECPKCGRDLDWIMNTTLRSNK
ncbi:MAG TPA: AmmeMemoRadiSam system radical SAM enzyme [Firmicutes bacterium]|nr:AmmeMemoRadiSam system radical SAM enzyme [Bacillota bacterium]